MKTYYLLVIPGILSLIGCSTLGPNRSIDYAGMAQRFRYVPDAQDFKYESVLLSNDARATTALSASVLPLPSSPVDRPYFRTYYLAHKKSKEARNEILNDLKAIIDDNFYTFEQDFGAGKRTKDFITQTAAIGLNAAGTLTTQGVTQILSAASGSLISTNTKFDETTFVAQTVQTIQLEMRTLRMKQANTLTKGMNDDPSVYSLEQGISDLLEYYQAGTFGRAMSSIAARSGSAQQAAQDVKDNAAVPPSSNNATTNSAPATH